MLSNSFLFSVMLVLLSIYALKLSLFVVDLPRALLRILSNISGGVFCKNGPLSVSNHFRKKVSLQIFDSVLHTTPLLSVKVWKKLHFSKIDKFSNISLNLAGYTCSMHCTANYYNSMVCLRVSLPLRKIHIAKLIFLYKNRPRRDTLIS